MSRWYAQRPFLTSWGFLAAGMAILVVLFGHDAGLTLRQHTILVAITIGLAWLCTWIAFLDGDATKEADELDSAHGG